MRVSLCVLLAGLLIVGCGPSDDDTNDNNANDNNANNNANDNTNQNSNDNNANGNNNNNVPPGCGDGEIQFGELCDEGSANSDTVPNACRTNCQPAGCGDGVIDTGEQCDGQNLDSQDCTDHSADGGDLACNACDFDTSGCTTCGNSQCEVGETLSSCPADCGLVKVAAGGDHSCVLVGNGEVRCWGRNDNGQLGDGTFAAPTAPVTVTGLTDAVDLTCGSKHCCVVRTGGTVECWGFNEAGQLGNSSTNQSASPVPVTGLTNATQVAAGNEHNCVVKGDFTVWCWGANYYGQLGDNRVAYPFSNVPVQVSGLAGAAQVSCGAQHSCAQVGLVGRCWGSGGNGRLGNNSSDASYTPVPVSNTTNFNIIAAGDGHTCGLLNTGAMECWGHNADGQLGNNDTGNDSWTPAPVSITGVADITAGTNHTCAVLSNGTAQCWGDGQHGQIGNSSDSDRPTPTAVSNASGYGPSISSNRNHTCVLYGTSGVRCWGEGAYGKLGGSGTANSNVPVTVLGL